jgi:hypothetical protein
MPDGLATTLAPNELLDVVEYLSSLKEARHFVTGSIGLLQSNGSTVHVAFRWLP